MLKKILHNANCFFLLLFGSSQRKVILLIKLQNFFYKKNRRILFRYFRAKLESGFGLYISPNAVLGEGLSLPHPVGIIIGDGVVVGDNVTIYQGVTLGGARRGDWQSGNYPKVGTGAVLFSGAVLAGDITIGRNAIIGANAVVLSDVPDRATAVGVPARIVKGK